jgi:hypothetical protein
VIEVSRRYGLTDHCSTVGSGRRDTSAPGPGSKAPKDCRQQSSTRRPEATVTVTELCRLADVSRNSLYSYHAPVLKALRDHQRHGPQFAQAKARKSAVQRRAENVGLRAGIAKLAALFDHYYTAYRETASTLERRDRELAELRNKLKLRPALLPSTGRQ